MGHVWVAPGAGYPTKIIQISTPGPHYQAGLGNRLFEPHTRYLHVALWLHGPSEVRPVIPV